MSYTFATIDAGLLALGGSSVQSFLRALGLAEIHYVTECVLTVPRQGGWGAQITVTGDVSGDAGVLTLSDENGDDYTWAGDIIALKKGDGNTRITLVGGKWVYESKSSAANFPPVTPVGVIALAMLAEIQRLPSPLTDPGFATQTVNNWQTLSTERLGFAFKRLASLGSNIVYRIDKDGLVGFFDDQFDDPNDPGGLLGQAASVAGDLLGLTKPKPSIVGINANEVELATNGFPSYLYPGYTFKGGEGSTAVTVRIEEVVYHFSQQNPERVILRQASQYTQQKDEIEDATQGYLFGRLFSGKCTTFVPGIGASIIADDEMIRGLGLFAVPVHTGIPGEVQLLPGADVLFTFLAGDPQRPVVIAFGPAAAAAVLSIKLGTGLDAVALATLTNTNFSSLYGWASAHSTLYTAHTHVSAAPASPTSPPVVPDVPPVAMVPVDSLIVKAT